MSTQDSPCAPVTVGTAVSDLGEREDDIRMRYMHPGIGWFFWPRVVGAGLLTLLWLGLIGLLIWGIVRLFSGRPRGTTPVGTPWQPYGATPAGGPSAIEILRQRYARGEIDDTTFQQMMERLQASMPGEPYSGGTTQ